MRVLCTDKEDSDAARGRDGDRGLGDSGTRTSKSETGLQYEAD